MKKGSKGAIKENKKTAPALLHKGYTAFCTTIPPTAPALRLQCYIPSTTARTMAGKKQNGHSTVPNTGSPDINPLDLLRDQREKVETVLRHIFTAQARPALSPVSH